MNDLEKDDQWEMGNKYHDGIQYEQSILCTYI
jgi:hypothetical protein